LGAVVRDAEGEVVATATWLAVGFADAATAEAYAMLKAIEFTYDRCFKSVFFESDC
ncbi:hypothetical protein A2U01_0053509, partial [Trifolium medium]|nr:hypothetical protein [Trifolium medium]